MTESSRHVFELAIPVSVEKRVAQAGHSVGKSDGTILMCLDQASHPVA